MITPPLILSIPSCTSTSSCLRIAVRDAESVGEPLPHGTVFSAWAQTAGRGQRGNSWEAAPGANLTFSMLLRPRALHAREQFRLSMAVSVAIADRLRLLIPSGSGSVAIKWPNDIYVDDRKICGILIENSLSGPFISWSVAGIGININQARFVSDAPNPVSLSLITATDYPLSPLLNCFATDILREVDAISDESAPALSARYARLLWRGEGFHPYLDVASSTRFMARILSVDPDGILNLLDTDGCHRRYAFKEVSSILTPDVL